ncbi:MAG: EAL domain-containing protein [Chloroflexota bacterium]
MRPSSLLRAERGLKLHLLLPVLGLVFLGITGIAAIEEYAARVQTRELVSQRAATLLEGVSRLLSERQRAKVLAARNIAEERDLPTLVEIRNVTGLARLLVPLKARLELGFIEVKDAAGRTILRLGAEAGEGDEEYVQNAQAGLSASWAVATSEGLQVGAIVPVKGPSGIVGTLAVGRDFGGADLAAAFSTEGIGLAVYSDDGLAASSDQDPELLAVLSAWSPGSDTLDVLDDGLESLARVGVRRDLDQEGTLVAFVSVHDLVRAASLRAMVLGAVGLLLTGGMLVVAAWQTRMIATPVATMARVADAITRGDYDQRVAATRVRELNRLSGSINHLATELDAQRSELERRAFFDALTGLPNRALFMDRLERALGRAARRHGYVAAMFLDLDNFKVINDSLGHEAGDELLVALARRLQGCIREDDTLARIGGDEFTVLVDDLDSVENARETAELIARRIAAVLATPLLVQGRETFASTSIGIAVSRASELEAGPLLRDADLAMYRAKSAGKNGFVVFSPEMGVDAMERMEVENELRRAIETGQLRLHYQPIVDLDSGMMREVEALVRWQHPRFGLVPPLKFIPIAEETGLVLPLGRWVLREACQQLRAWRDAHPGSALETVSVNLSGRQLQNVRLVEEITEILAETGLPAECLKLELTESVLMRDVDATISTFERLRALGIKLAIDDFGTGYSSLAYLKRFPLDILKIDRTFVDGLDRDGDSTAIVRNVIELAKSLSLAVTGEGIETPSQADRLRELGCQQGQGYYYARPIPSLEVEALLASTRPLPREAADAVRTAAPPAA